MDHLDVEKNTRDLFEDAINDKKNNKTDLHLIIFDEFDAIGKKRGLRTGDTGVSDQVVNTLLTMIDGVNSIDNILLICMTNRKDLIDEALLRPGRLEVHLEIKLPTKEGRVDILNIHTRNMKENNRLDKCVDISLIAEITKNFSGADIEGLVRNATGFAISREINMENIADKNKNINPLVKHSDFTKY